MGVLAKLLYFVHPINLKILLAGLYRATDIFYAVEVVKLGNGRRRRQFILGTFLQPAYRDEGHITFGGLICSA